MLTIEKYQKIYYCRLKDNCPVNDSNGSQRYQCLDSVTWSGVEKERGKVIKIKNFPGSRKEKLFRVVFSTKLADNMMQNDTQAVQEVYSSRRKVEQFHRETKQLTGLEGCQYRQARIVPNLVACAILIWVHLKQLSNKTEQTVYRLNMICYRIICDCNSNHLLF